MTRQAIRDRVVHLIARHSGVPADRVDPAVSVWESFPPSYRATHPTVAAFEADLLREFPVYLTEEEFEISTVEELADILAAKLADPARSERDRRLEAAALLKGMLMGWAFLNALLAGTFLLDEHEQWASGRYVWYLAVAVCFNAGWAYAFWRQRLAIR